MKRIAIAGLVFAGATAATVGVVAGRDSVDKPSKPASGLVELKDQKAGFALSYPAGWKPLPSKDRDVAAVIVEPRAGGSILARVTDLETEIKPEDVAGARSLTDAVINAGTGVELKVEPTTVNMGGLPGYFYFYTFADSASGQRGAHSHYFLFKGRTMISLVFQGVPESEFVRLGPKFDQVANSFRVLKG